MPIVPGFVYGVVVKNRDPLGLGRVKVRVDGWQENELSYWCRPGGWPGAGGGVDGDPKQGSQYPVRVGAQVILIFEHGNTEDGAVFFPAQYGLDKDGGNAGPNSTWVASLAEGKPEKCNERITIWENDTFALYITDHDDDKRIVLVEKTSGTSITIDAMDGAEGQPMTSKTISIEAQTAIYIHSGGLLKIEADAQLELQGRPVMRGGGSI